MAMIALAAGESKVSEAELAALRDKAASLDKELKELLAARERKAKADAQEADTAEFAETLRVVGDVVSGDTMN